MCPWRVGSALNTQATRKNIRKGTNWNPKVSHAKQHSGTVLEEQLERVGAQERGRLDRYSSISPYIGLIGATASVLLSARSRRCSILLRDEVASGRSSSKLEGLTIENRAAKHSNSR